MNRRTSGKCFGPFGSVCEKKSTLKSCKKAVVVHQALEMVGVDS